MEKRNAKPSRQVVVPGDILSTRGEKGGENTYEMDGKLYASILGVKNMSPNGISVIPINGVYMPVTGDTVIGIIEDIAASNWMVNISAPYPAPLHVNEVPWKVEFGDTSKYLNIGDTVLLKVLMVDESKKIQVTMNDSGLRKLEGGQVVDIPYSKVSRVIGKSGSMIQMLKNMTDCRIFVGQNGRIWIDGDDENVEVAAEAIRIIEAESRSANLTDRVREFIEKKLPQSEEEDDEEDFE